MCTNTLSIVLTEILDNIVSHISNCSNTNSFFLSKSYFFLTKQHILKYVAVYREQVVQHDDT